jgi:hypothetical protein
MSLIFLGFAFKKKKLSHPEGAPTPPLSTPGAPECHAVPQGAKCGTNSEQGTRPRSTFASSDYLRKAGAKTQDLGPRRSSD